MKKSFSLIRLLFCLLLCGFSIAAQNFQKVADGIEHARLVRPLKPSADGKQQNAVINLLRLDLRIVRLDAVHALDTAIGLEKTSSIASRYGAAAAINGGFFRIDRSIFEGDEIGILQIDGKLLSESYANRTALLIKNERTATQISFEKLAPPLDFFSGKICLKLSGINRERKSDELILYTPEFHLTTLTGNDGLEIAVENGRVIGIFEGRGSNRIPSKGFILSASGREKDKLKSLKIGERINPIRISRGNSRAGDVFNRRAAEDIISGAPQLIKNGRIEITWEQEKMSKSFVETRHPRTAVGKLKDGKFLMATIDGRSEQSAGMNLYELAEFLLETGAVDALNMDGGGSTTMFLNGKVINQPSDKEGERKIGDAILVTPRK